MTGRICGHCESEFLNEIWRYIDYQISDRELDDPEEIMDNLIQKCREALETFHPTHEGDVNEDWHYLFLSFFIWSIIRKKM